MIAELYRNNKENWRDWKWQQRNICKDTSSLKCIFPELTDSVVKSIDENLVCRKMQITPYSLLK